MKDEEFNRYCAEVRGLVIKGKTGDGALWVIEPHRHQLDGWFYNPAKEIGQMAEVFDKLVSELLIKCHDPDAPENLLFSQLSLSIVSDGIAQAMREFIESTKP